MSSAMLLSSSLSCWSRELSEVDGDSQFNSHVLDIPLGFYDSAAPILHPSQAKVVKEDHPFSPPQVLSDSTFSLLSRKYSPSTTDSSCECSETSSVDENFPCGSGSPNMSPANWDSQSEHIPGNLSVDGSAFSLDATTNVPIIPLAGMPAAKQPQQPSLSQTSHGEEVDADSTTVGDKDVAAPSGRRNSVRPKQSRNITVSLNIEEQSVSVELLQPAATNTNGGEILTVTATDIVLQSPGAFPSSVKSLRSALSSVTHSCSACHLYAPSSSETFYFDAWLNQQNDIRTRSLKKKKRVSWPDTTAQLRTVIIVDKWIEKGMHVHPQPPLHRSDLDCDHEWDSEQEEDCEQEEGKLATRIKQAKVAQSQWDGLPSPPNNPSLTAGPSRNPGCSSNSPTTSLKSNGNTSLRASRPPLQKTKTYLAKKVPPSPSTSLPTTSSISSESEGPQQQQVRVSQSPSKTASASRVVTQLPAPKKQFSSGVTVKIIGGPYTEHEAAMKIRGMDPIKHRAMIENYWQY